MTVGERYSPEVATCIIAAGPSVSTIAPSLLIDSASEMMRTTIGARNLDVVGGGVTELIGTPTMILGYDPFSLVGMRRGSEDDAFQRERPGPFDELIMRNERTR